MPDDHGTQLHELNQANRQLAERLERSVRISKNLYKRLRSARAEAAGRKAHAEDLKARIIEQHGQLCEQAATQETAMTRTPFRTVVSILAVEEGTRLDCCDEDTAHVWVTVLTWSPRRAYLTGASPFIAAAEKAWGTCEPKDLKDAHFYADLPAESPPAEAEPGERLEWPELELCPPMDEIKRELGIS